jgi:hypothetical protein
MLFSDTDRHDVAYLVNSTPKYYYLLPLHFALIRRYAPNLKWPLYIATEGPNNPTIQEIASKYDVSILPLQKQDRYFLESHGRHRLLFHKQSSMFFQSKRDFLLQNRIDEGVASNAIKILDDDPDVLSIRLMPCPGPPTNPPKAYSVAPFLHTESQVILFTYQATLFRRGTYSLFMSALVEFPLPLLAQILKTTYIPDSEANEEQLAERKRTSSI